MWTIRSRLSHLTSERLVSAGRLSQYARKPRAAFQDPRLSRSKPIHNKMKTLNRAWSIHPTVYENLRRHILVKPKFKGHIATRKIGAIQNNVCSNSFTDRIKTARPQEFLQVAQDLLTLPQQKLFQSAKSLERECCQRLSKWNIEEILLAMDIFFVAKFRAPMLYNCAFHSIDLCITSLDIEPKHVVQLLFYISVYRNSPVSLMRDLENIINSEFENFTANEIGLICHAFFTSNTSFVNYDLVQLLSEMLLSHIGGDDLMPSLISNIVKALRHADFQNIHFHQELGNILSQNTDHRDYKQTAKSQIEVFRTLYSLGFIHEQFCERFLSHCAETLLQNKDFFRFKDLVSLVWGSQTLQVNCPDVVVDLLYELVQTHFTVLGQQYPEKFVESLVALALVDKYPVSALAYSLSSTFIQVTKERQLEQNFQLMLLDTSIQLKCPNFKGNTLSQEFLQSVPQRDLCDISKQLNVRQGLSTIMATLQKLLGSHMAVKCHNVLNFSKIPDLEIQLKKTGEPITFAAESQEPVALVNSQTKRVLSVLESLTDSQGIMGYRRSIPQNFHLLPRSSGDIHKVIVKVLGWHQYAINRPVLLGIHLYELRLLQDLGFEVITINPMHAAQIENMTQVEQENYVQKQILDKISSQD